MKFGRVNTCIAIASIYLVLRIFAAYVKPTNASLGLMFILGIISIAVFMFLQAALVVSFSGLKLKVRTAATVLILSAICLAAAVFLERLKVHGISPILGGISDLALMFSAASIGCMVSFIIKEPGIIFPIAVCAAMMDFWNVIMGPLGKIAEHRPDILDKVAVHVPSISPHVPVVLMGMGDVLFLAMFFGALFRFSMNTKGAFIWGYVLLTISMYAVIFFIPALPALVPMGIAISISNWKNFELKREELLSTICVAALLLGIILLAAKRAHKMQMEKMPVQKIGTHATEVPM